jgi:hypothetical protein
VDLVGDPAGAVTPASLRRGTRTTANDGSGCKAALRKGVAGDCRRYILATA